MILPWWFLLGGREEDGVLLLRLKFAFLYARFHLKRLLIFKNQVPVPVDGRTLGSVDLALPGTFVFPGLAGRVKAQRW